MVQLAATAAVSSLASFGIGKVLGGLFGKKSVPPPPRRKTPVQAKEVFTVDPLSVQPDPGGPHIGVFGRWRVGGRVILSEKSGDETFIVIALAGGKLTAINGLYVNDLLVSIDGSGNVVSSPWATGLNYSMNVALYDGTQTTVDSELDSAFPGWGAQHIGYGVSYARIKIDPTAHVSFEDVYKSGIPDFTFDVQGFACYDPRNESHLLATPSTWTYSTNAAIIAANYLIHELGAALPVSDVDWTATALAADVCDEVVAKADGGTEYRYAVACYWLTNERHESVLEKLGAAFAGGVRLLGDKWAPYVGKWIDPTATITPDDYVSEGVQWSESPPLSELYNGVRGTFSSPLHNFEPRDFPAYQDTTALADDNSRELWLDLDLQFVTSASQAQRLARLAYNRARYGFSASMSLKFKHIDIVADDVVQVTDDLADWTNKTFRVVSDEVDENYEVSLALEHDAQSFYEFDPATDEKPFVVYPSVSTGSSGGGTVISGGLKPPGFIIYDPDTDSNMEPNIKFWYPPSAITKIRIQIWRETTTGTSIITQVVDETLDLETSPGVFLDGKQYSSLGSLTSAARYWRFRLTSIDAGGAESPIAQVEHDDSSSNRLATSVAASTVYKLPALPPPTVGVASIGSADLDLVPADNTSGVAQKLDQILLYENATSDPNTATLIHTRAHSAGTHTVTHSSASVRYYWTRGKVSGTGELGPLSDTLLVVFS